MKSMILLRKARAQMKYRLLNNKKGALLTIGPEKATERLPFEFEGAEGEQMLVLNTGHRVIYRDIIDGACAVETTLLMDGEALVSVMSSQSPSEKIACDSLYVVSTKECVIVMRNDSEREKIVKELRIENDELRRRLSKNEEEIKRLSQRLEEIYDGYDIL